MSVALTATSVLAFALEQVAEEETLARVFHERAQAAVGTPGAYEASRRISQIQDRLGAVLMLGRLLEHHGHPAEADEVRDAWLACSTRLIDAAAEARLLSLPRSAA